MNIRLPSGILLRMVAMYIGASALCYSFPKPILRALEPFVRVTADWTSPYVEKVQLTLQDKMIRVDCHVRLE